MEDKKKMLEALREAAREVGRQAEEGLAKLDAMLLNPPPAPDTAPRMGRPDALRVLAKLARRRDLSEEEVVAIRMGFRAIEKRFFESERNWKRRHEREAKNA